KASQLRFIAREGVGLEHIDVAYAEGKGIEVIISPEGSRDTVGEHAIGLLLMLMNRLSVADREVRAGGWNRESNRGTEIMGKTVGLIGYGNMGQSMARRLSGFGCAAVLAYDKYRENYGDRYAKAVDLKTLQARADIVSLHIPYEADNHHFVNAAFLQAFTKPIYLINTARGLVLNTADLIASIQQGKVLGAGLDVLEYEEGSFDALGIQEWPAPFQYLIESDQVVLSPHIAGWSFESKRKHGEVLDRKIIRQFGS
ncbi:MAG: NAD(P)-dependent oxidoreductase, partial [Bacteroidota bacterium]